jgi:hypothetical protein
VAVLVGYAVDRNICAFDVGLLCVPSQCSESSIGPHPTTNGGKLLKLLGFDFTPQNQKDNAYS